MTFTIADKMTIQKIRHFVASRTTYREHDIIVARDNDNRVAYLIEHDGEVIFFNGFTANADLDFAKLHSLEMVRKIRGEA